eukprot:scaffold16475_cov19-Tisochrysis_lutea.AAC.2
MHAQEDAALRDHVQRHGPKKWERAAQLIPGRTDKSCRLRLSRHYALPLPTILQLILALDQG